MFYDNSKDKKVQVVNGIITEPMKVLHKKKIKLFTHTDLDGISCNIILNRLFDKNAVSISCEYLNYSDFDKIIEFFDNYQEAASYDLVISTDLNFTPCFIEKLMKHFDDFCDKKNNIYYTDKVYNFFKKFIIIDHHKDSLILNNIDQRNEYMEYYNNEKDCATKQFFHLIIFDDSGVFSKELEGCENPDHTVVKFCESYVELVNDWDLFLWKDKNNLAARDLNLLFTSVDHSKFCLWQYQKKAHQFYWNESEKKLIRDTIYKINKEFEKCYSNAKILDHYDCVKNMYDKHIQYMVVKLDDNVSLISDMMIEKIKNEIHLQKNIEYIVFVSFKHKACSVRRVNPNFKCNVVASFFGGGGHEFSAGFPIRTEDELAMKLFILPAIDA